MRREPDCNRTDLDDEGDPEELDFEDDINDFSGLEGEDDNED